MQNGQTEPQSPSCVGVDVGEEETRLLTCILTQMWAGDWRHDLERAAGTHNGTKRLELEEVRAPEAPNIGVYLCLCDTCVCLCMWHVQNVDYMVCVFVCETCGTYGYICVADVFVCGVWTHGMSTDVWHVLMVVCLYKVDSFSTYEVWKTRWSQPWWG